MTYRLGVDLGTTFTAAAVANGGPPTMLGLGNRALQVPSVLYLPADGDLVVGEAAERRGASDPSRVVREFKRRIGDHVPMLVAGVPYSPQALTAQLLHWVVRAGTDQMGEPPSRVILTYPANWGPYKRELLAQVVELADVGEVITCSEPEAAAVQYAAKSRVPVGARIAMYDLGGGTFDTCVLEKRADGFVMLGEPVGIEHLGGIDFDDAVFQHVLEALGDGVSELDPSDPNVQTGLARLRRDCVDAKEALSSDVQVIVPVVLPGWNTSVRLTRSELEDLIQPPLEDTVNAVGRAIRSAGIEPSDLQAIVLVGGGSRIPLVRELLQQAFAVPTALDTHPKHDVALGAVQVGRPGVDGPAGQRPADITEVIAPVDRTDVIEPVREPIAEPVADPDSEPAADPVREPDAERVVDPADDPLFTLAPIHPRAPTWSDSVKVKPPGARTPPGTRDWFKPALAIGSALAVLAVGAGVFALTRGDDKTPSANPSRTAQPTAPAGSALPASGPLTDQQLLVPMKRADNWDIYLADAGVGVPVKQLTSDPEQDFSPSLSPDRRTVIFVHQEGSTRTLRVMAADGTGVRDLFNPIPPQCASVFRPAWNPVDPTMLAIACIDANGTNGLYLVRTDGRVLRKLPVGQPRVDDPAFSPDGKTVAYQAGPDSPKDGGSIYRIGVDGGAPQRLTNVAAGTDADPTFSPDGKELVFRRRQPDGTISGNFDICVIPADGSGTSHAIVKGEADDQDPSWAPDSDQLAFKSSRLTAGGKGAGPNRIWLVKPDGTDLRLLWTQAGNGEAGAPAWNRR